MERARKLKKYFGKLMVIEDNALKNNIAFMLKDINFLNIISKELEKLEERMIELLSFTPAISISGQIPGISDMQLASYIGLVGDINRYKDAGAIFSKAGLCPRTKQSGLSSVKGLGIRKI